MADAHLGEYPVFREGGLHARAGDGPGHGSGHVLEAIKLADEVGLDYFGAGEHHTRAMPLSSPTSVVNAAAAATRRIKLSTAVTVLSTDDPIRVFQQLATAASLAPGRVELVAGRGSSAITFPLFDHDEHDYDMLYASKLDLLTAINAGENVTWARPRTAGGRRRAQLLISARARNVKLAVAPMGIARQWGER